MASNGRAAAENFESGMWGAASIMTATYNALSAVENRYQSDLAHARAATARAVSAAVAKVDAASIAGLLADVRRLRTQVDALQIEADELTEELTGRPAPVRLATPTLERTERDLVTAKIWLLAEVSGLEEEIDELEDELADAA